MTDTPPKKQDGGAIFDALAAIEGPIEREQPTEQQERDFSNWDEPTPEEREQELAQAYRDAAEDMRNDPLFHMDTAHGPKPSGEKEW